MHNCRYGRVTPKTRATFWEAKRRGTVARDEAAKKRLQALGWKVIDVWECQTRDADGLLGRIDTLLQEIGRTIDRENPPAS